MRYLGLLLVPIALVGCARSRPHVATVPASAWHAAGDSPRTSEPVTRHRDPVRQPSVAALSREQVLEIANRRDPQDAIAEIDRHPLGFALNNQNIGWFEDRVVPPELVDYLRKRGAVDWEALNTPAPSPQPQADPDRYATWDQPPQQPTVYVVESPRPTTVIYERTYTSSYVPPACYTPTYYAGAVYVGGSVSYGYGRSHVSHRSTYV